MKKNIVKFCMLLMPLLFVGCLDDDKQALDPEGYENIIEFYNISIPISPAGAVYPSWGVAFPVSAPGQSETFDLVISYSGPQSNNKDIEVELEVNPAALDIYNDRQGYAYELLPAAFYTLPTTVTIPKGETKVTFTVPVRSDLFDLSKSYALPITIASTSSGIISGNFGTAIFVTVAKNQYDGVYRSTGYFQHPTAPRAIDRLKNYITTSANTNQTEFADLGSAVEYQINPDNTVDFFGTVPQNAYMLPSITVGGVTYNNTYDPATRTLYLYYEYVGANGLRTIYERIVYQSERD